jgi:hypothetical protein
MKQKLTIIFLTTLVMMTVALNSRVAAAEFTAVLFSVHPNGDTYPVDTLKPNLWVKGNVYRYEGNFQEHPIVIISNKDTDTAWFLDTQGRTYYEAKRSEGGVPDPIQSWDLYFSRLKKQKLGVETIKGYPCTKYKFTDENGIWAMQWISDSLGMYLKQVTHYTNKAWTSTELVNIKPAPIDDKLFLLPKNYVPAKTPPQMKPKMDVITGEGKK